MSCTQNFCAKFSLKYSDIKLCLTYFPERQNGRFEVSLLSGREHLHLFWYLGYHLSNTPQFILNYESSSDLLHSIVCKWVHLNVTVAKSSQPFREGFTVTWTASAQNPEAEMLVEDRFDLRSGEHWYGGGEFVRHHWQFETFHLESTPFVTWDSGPTGIGNVLQPMWSTSTGAALFCQPQHLFHISSNALRQHDFLKHAKDAIRPLPVLSADDGDGFLSFKVLKSHLKNELKGNPNNIILLKYHVSVFKNVAVAQQMQLSLLDKPAKEIPLEMFKYPIWTTWARYKTDINQEKVLQFAKEIVEHHFHYSVLEIDDKWCSEYGDFEFDSVKFPNARQMIRALHQMGFKVTVWITPFATASSRAFRKGVEKGYWVRGGDNHNPALVRWWNGNGVLLDVTNKEATSWFIVRLKHFQKEYDIDGFKFDAGEGNYVPEKSHFSSPLLHPSYYSKYWVEKVAKSFDWSEVRCGYESQQATGLVRSLPRGVADKWTSVHGTLRSLTFQIRQWDKFSVWGLDNGLQATVTSALTFGILGYPFVLPDMIGGNGYNNLQPDKELMVRWTQANALLPAIQFSYAPWDFDNETVQLCLDALKLRERFIDAIIRLADDARKTGHPIIRPLLWLSPDDKTTHTIWDHYAVGDSIIVAPVMVKGQTWRDVYLPHPTRKWQEVTTSIIYDGGKWHKISVSLASLPIFLLQ
jgi:hypothetical protein